MATPVVRILHISDLHLIQPGSVQLWLEALSQLPINLGQIWQREDYDITLALPTELAALCTGLPSVVALTGDIGTYPEDSPAVINHHQYDLIQRLPQPLYPILGNHDWRFDHTTHYAASKFETQFDITSLRFEVFTERGVTLVLFMIDTNIRMVPAQGWINPTTAAWLTSCFAAGRQGKLGNLTSEQYDSALKVLLLHHSPLERAQYFGALGRIEYWLLQLRDRPELLQLCKDDIDIMLFGHTHVPINLAWNGFLMISCGTTTALGGWKDDNNLQRLTVYDDLSVDVQPYNWSGTRFLAQPRSVRYRRGAAIGAVVGARQWG